MSIPAPVEYLSLPTDPLFRTWIEINGEPVTLYGKQVLGAWKTICFIEVPPLEERHSWPAFTMHFSDRRTKRRRGFQASVLVDGQWKRGKNVTVEAPPGEWKLNASKDNRGNEQPLKFTPIPLEGEYYLKAGSAGNMYGSVELRYRRIKKAVPRNSEVKEEETNQESMLRRSGSSREQPQPPTPAKREKELKYTYRDTKEVPYHTFEFCYRSRSFLSSQRLLPGSRAPFAFEWEDPLPVEPNVPSPSPEPDYRRQDSNDTTPSTSTNSGFSGSGNDRDSLSGGDQSFEGYQPQPQRRGIEGQKDEDETLRVGSSQTGTQREGEGEGEEEKLRRLELELSRLQEIAQVAERWKRSSLGGSIDPGQAGEGVERKRSGELSPRSAKRRKLEQEEGGNLNEGGGEVRGKEGPEVIMIVDTDDE